MKRPRHSNRGVSVLLFLGIILSYKQLTAPQMDSWMNQRLLEFSFLDATESG